MAVRTERDQILVSMLAASFPRHDVMQVGRWVLAGVNGAAMAGFNQNAAAKLGRDRRAGLNGHRSRLPFHLLSLRQQIQEHTRREEPDPLVLSDLQQIRIS